MVSPEKTSRLFARFQRITSGGAYVAEIDGLRFIAILAVFFFHIGRMTEIHLHVYEAPANPLLAFVGTAIFHGERGVAVFFAVSGFVLGIPFVRARLLDAPKVPIRQYLLRRLTRIEPPYVISQLIRIYPVMLARSLSFLQILPHFVAGLLYVHLLAYGTMPTVQLVGWSLEIEVQFYLLAPVLAAVFYQKPVWARRGLLVGFLVLHSLLVPILGDAAVGNPMVGSSLARLLVNTILFWSRFFVAGMLVADLYATMLPKMRTHWLWDVVSLACWTWAFLTSTFFWYLLGPFVLLPAFVGAFKGYLVPRFFRIPLVATIGGMCYSLYLTHSLVLQVMYVAYMKVLPGISGFFPRMLVGELILPPFLLAAGAVYFVLVERPCMDKQWPVKSMAWLRKVLYRALPAAETE